MNLESIILDLPSTFNSLTFIGLFLLLALVIK